MKNKNHLETEITKCLICNDIKYDLQTNHLLSDKSFSVVKCVCGFVYLNPRPTENSIAIFYDDKYLPHNSNKYNFILRTLQNLTFRWKKNTINRLLADPDSLLDVGSGDGAFAKYMKKNGWDVAQYDKFSSKFDKTNYLNKKYQLITMWHSLEHLHDIDNLVNNIYDLLSDESYLLIAVPNYNSIDRKIFKDKWIALDVPRHLYHFTSITLEKYLLKKNIKIVSKKTMYQDTIFNVALSIKNIFILKIIFFPFILLISFFYTFVNKENSSSILYICQKK